MEYIDIHLFEPSTSAKILKSVTLAGPDAEEDLTAREKDWLVSHLKEELGKFALACRTQVWPLACIKYITKTQVIRVKMDSGTEKEYTVSEVEVSTKAQAKSVAGLADGLASLAIGQNDGFEIYEMDWRTKINLQVDGDRKTGEGAKSTAKTVRPPADPPTWADG
jgi:hypothetical protein